MKSNSTATGGFLSILAYNQQLAAIWKENDREKTYDVILDCLYECKVDEFPVDSPEYEYMEDTPPEVKECYSNSLRFIMNNDNFSYVLGYAHSLIPITHAWVCRLEDGVTKYYDPTGQMLKLSFSGYGVVKVFTTQELSRIISEIGRAPMLEDIHMWAGNCCNITPGNTNALGRINIETSDTIH